MPFGATDTQTIPHLSEGKLNGVVLALDLMLLARGNSREIAKVRSLCRMQCVS